MQQPPSSASISDALEAQLRECFGRVAYSHKTHEKAADLLEGRLHMLKTTQIGLSAITTTGLVAVVFAGAEAARCAALASTAFSTLLLCLTTYTKDFDLGSASQAHKQAADRLWIVRENYLSLLTDVAAGAVNETTARSRRNELQDELALIYRSAPRTFPNAYGAAQQALKVKEDLTFSDEEIDALLPASIRKGERP